ncbi:MAG: hypothetical protein LAT61_06195 [Alcanivorax sp.]|nr:hypothetical protein [Alcanivorax sp.]
MARLIFILLLLVVPKQLMGSDVSTEPSLQDFVSKGAVFQDFPSRGPIPDALSRLFRGGGAKKQVIGAMQRADDSGTAVIYDCANSHMVNLLSAALPRFSSGDLDNAKLVFLSGHKCVKRLENDLTEIGVEHYFTSNMHEDQLGGGI